MKFLKHHVPEFVIGMFSVVCSLVIIIIRGKNDLLGPIVALSGCQLTIVVFLLKSEMHARLDTLNQRLELYDLVRKISHPGLRHRAAETIENATEIVRKLSKGIVIDRADKIFQLLADEIPKAKEEILAVHVVRTLADIAVWNRPPMSFYYERTAEAVRRGVRVRRIFILFKSALEPHTGHLKSDIKDALQRQKADRIDVLVAMEDDLSDKGYIKDLAVIDRRVAEYSSGSGDFVSNKPSDRTAYFTVERREVARYVEKFELLEKFAKGLDRWLSEYDKDPLEDELNPHSQAVM